MCGDGVGTQVWSNRALFVWVAFKISIKVNAQSILAIIESKVAGVILTGSGAAISDRLQGPVHTLSNLVSVSMVLRQAGHGQYTLQSESIVTL